MPKSNQSSSPSIPHSKPGSDDPTSRLTDVALRKKKNADAQAAFRARRANYIATLEETVTSLESVVLQLQDSCREARNEAADLRQDNARLRHEIRDHERHWRAFCQSTKGAVKRDDLHTTSPTFSPVHSRPRNLSTTHPESSNVDHFSTDSLYGTNDEQSTGLCNDPYSTGHGQSYDNHSPPLPYIGTENEPIAGDGSSRSLNTHRAPPKYGLYQYSIQNRDSPWPQPMTTSRGESGRPTSTSSSHSPSFVDSPTLSSSDVPYVGHFSDDQKVPLNNLDTAPYIFPGSRSLSPSSTPPSSTSTSLTSSFQFTFPEGSITHEQLEFDYRRQSNHQHSTEVTLHGGTADISLGASPGCDVVRYRLETRQTERTVLPTLPPTPSTGVNSQTEHKSNEGETSMYSRLRPRHATPSPSPGASCPPISGTLAVIKAQAFGALRRTRARTKRSSEGAAKVAMDVLEASGIGMGVGVPACSKRARLQGDEDEIQICQS